MRTPPGWLGGPALPKLLLNCRAPVTVMPPTASRPLVVCFTGTSTLEDLREDVRFFARPWPLEDATAVSKGCLVHGGFADRTSRLCSEELVDTLLAHPHAVLAGHSVGGACAVLLASWLASTGRCRHTVCTYGAPRLANAAFCEAYREAGLWDRTWRHRTPGDLVTRIPPWLQHVGIDVTVPSNGNGIAQHSLSRYVASPGRGRRSQPRG